jgi:hypothetical protein
MRKSPRTKVCFPVEYQSMAEMRQGMVANISFTGALLESASESIEPGTRLVLRCSIFVGSFDIELAGEIVRNTDGGFAVEFVDLGRSQVELLRRIFAET